MEFSVHPKIVGFPDLQAFFGDVKIGEGDLLITNEVILSPHADADTLPCTVLFQERFGAGEPTDEMADAMLESVRGRDFKRIFAIGGGTVIDISKIFVFGTGYTVREIYERGAQLPKVSELYCVPTTSGTGSEVTGLISIGFVKEHKKIGLALPAFFADVAVLVAPLMKNLPYPVFCYSAVDAMIHAMEAHVSPRANLFTRACGTAAIETLIAAFIQMDGKRELPEDLEACLAASSLAGIAFGNAGCAAVHALSYSIAGTYHVAHGRANYLVLSGTFAMYRKLGADLSPLEKVLRDALGCTQEEVWRRLDALLDRMIPLKPLSTLGVTKSDCADFAEAVIKNQQRLMVNNPVELTWDNVREIYENLL
ncbi:MAG: iron-containing alcohol dehydrogenase [Christensenellales bacterium]|jgi:4-hydroxybutyrate dehydrogenase